MQSNTRFQSSQNTCVYLLVVYYILLKQICECLVLLSTFLWFDNFLLKACVEHSAIPDYYTHGMLAQFGERFLEYSMLHNTIALCNWTFGLSYLY